MDHNILQLTACTFLQRGCVGENLRKEVTNFANWLQQRESEGDMIRHPDKLLPNWNNLREHQTAPERGGVIANFAKAIDCGNIDIICSVGKIAAEGNKLYIWLYADGLQDAQEKAKVIDAEMIAHQEAARAFAAAAGASTFEYKIMPNV